MTHKLATMLKKLCTYALLSMAAVGSGAVVPTPAVAQAVSPEQAANVFEAAAMPHSELDVIASDGNEPDDALRLAARFYALAAALCTLLPLENLFDRQCERRNLASHAASGRVTRPSGWMAKPYDTS